MGLEDRQLEHAAQRKSVQAGHYLAHVFQPTMELDGWWITEFRVRRWNGRWQGIFKRQHETGEKQILFCNGDDPRSVIITAGKLINKAVPPWKEDVPWEKRRDARSQ